VALCNNSDWGWGCGPTSRGVLEGCRNITECDDCTRRQLAAHSSACIHCAFEHLSMLVIRRVNAVRAERSSLLLASCWSTASRVQLNVSLVSLICVALLKYCRIYERCFLGRHGSRVVSVLDSGSEGHRFKSQSRRCRVTVLGPPFPKFLDPPLLCVNAAFATATCLSVCVSVCHVDVLCPND